jgi:HlyD family secretion protein
MSAKSQNKNILITTGILLAVVVIVAVLGFLFMSKQPEVIQGQVEVSEYRVSSKLPGRVAEIRVNEGDYVHTGDTLAILEVPEVSAQKKAAQATESAAAAISALTENGARKETIESTFQVWQQTIAARDIAKKSYDRVQNLFNEGVISAQKRDEAFASYKAAEASVKASKSQYDMAKNGARMEEKKAAAEQAKAAQGAVDVVSSLLKETVQIAQFDGEVSDIYPKVGELVSLGSPIMSISIMSDMWGTFNVREDQLKGMKVGDIFKAYSPAFNRDIKMKVYYIKDEGSYAAWRATKASGQYDLRTFEVKARPLTKIEGLRPGMTLVIKED